MQFEKQLNGHRPMPDRHVTFGQGNWTLLIATAWQQTSVVGSLTTDILVKFKCFYSLMSIR